MQLPRRHSPIFIIPCISPGRQGAKNPIFPACDAGFADASAQDRGALLQVLVDSFLFFGIADCTALAGGGGGGADGAVEALRTVEKEGGGVFEGTHYS